ncbi:hydroxymethylglutaryl-CoA lyase [Niabella beijingensis]|uniref:hydroxymethylglutaryl-CoA lyase n=1 Tax=Niabella beijingensis TaxID=2872700 RepID=UPI001CBDAA0C|nr:hydroxymethylglutaryl-CoA lyase [Niabella beijingensis]MBZ4188098.1 hydroxymethylglutaryl-CoA lyase [Niabella beijingensis]
MSNSDRIHLTECPRDAQQGLPYTIPPEKRAAYINRLMQVGFDIIDFGSFVSPKAVPQMAESAKVLEGITKEGSATRLLAIIGNARGATEAAAQQKVDILGFPYSISDTFLERNIHSDSSRVLHALNEIADISQGAGKELRVYISMAFGNPYGDEWSEFIIQDAVYLLAGKGVQTITLSDTTGLGTPDMIYKLFQTLIPRFPGIELGLHLHTVPEAAYDKIDAAWKAGCRSFDGVLNGLGGCPLTGYELLGNVNTLTLLQYFRDNNIATGLDEARIRQTAAAYPDFIGLKS